MPSRRPPVLVRVLVVAGALAGLGYLIYARTRPDPVIAEAIAEPDPDPFEVPLQAGSAGSGSATYDRHFYGSKYLGNARR